ncbi:unnamed protein product [Cladocopium goreaui]|uniref:Probable acyl-CoA dehydrogenase IBR3 (Protei n INDOLE-3-BUTYRIC ACID RESPONSE 3) n=1 Tax=Cladocopium goreaui TaxID=2562237 RepID=A0A9P1BH80_9DINO|nr:unnamed protein product [Cladocopium goreaui]
MVRNALGQLLPAAATVPLKKSHEAKLHSRETVLGDDLPRPRLSFCTGRSWPKGGLGSNVKKTSRQEVGTPRARSQSRGPRLEAPRFEVSSSPRARMGHHLDMTPESVRSGRSLARSVRSLRSTRSGSNLSVDSQLSRSSSQCSRLSSLDLEEMAAEEGRRRLAAQLRRNAKSYKQAINNPDMRRGHHSLKLTVPEEFHLSSADLLGVPVVDPLGPIPGANRVLAIGQTNEALVSVPARIQTLTSLAATGSSFCCPHQKERLRFDEASLERFLSQQGLPGFKEGAIKVRKFGYGQSNPTYCLQVANHRYVLRKQPPGKLIRGAHAVDREFRVMKALNQVGYEVPPVHVLCEDPQVIGTPFYVMSFMEGRIADNGLLNLPKEERPAVMQSIVQSLAKLHGYDPKELGLLQGSKPFGKMGGFYERQIRTLQRTSEAQVSNSQGQVPPMKAMPELLRFFKDNMPPDRSCVIHGDWKPDNLILSKKKPPSVLAVVDWELSTIGHPMSDLANLCLPYHLGEFGKVVDYPPMGGDGGISEEEVLRSYCQAAGVEYPIDHWSFYTAFACFRLAVIIQGVAMRTSRGSASDGTGNVKMQSEAADSMCSLALSIMRKAFGSRL